MNQVLCDRCGKIITSIFRTEEFELGSSCHEKLGELKKSFLKNENE